MTFYCYFKSLTDTVNKKNRAQHRKKLLKNDNLLKMRSDLRMENKMPIKKIH
jgi:hypothetical protein